ncbi:nucleotide-diphospho-sugar transferase [Gilbertella persicaria]|uniref:nucleotide-diphospho-sugar transferase n=1 Tax=Gilbertella persicaria TaxID=101096 RepID=UPI00221EACAF|nr:nucleotide-diphospho-sugar transferase [Gilbertella persicaria]KAI8088071.1 nucleotide-diphospho-sugar transferase [Gilbertella persicaria]
MVTQPINELFDYPEFSAAVDIGGVLNTGVFVAEPNKGTYKDIMNTYSDAPSYNKGDQGFLNYYFNQTAHYLPGNYNLMVKFTHFSTLAAGFVSKNDVKVLHFTSETKPWNFHFLHQREWRENYDGHLFGLWTKALRRMRLELAEADLWDLPEWHNQKRTAFICDKQLKSNYGRRYPKTNQFTVILDLSPSTSVSSLKRLLQTYASFSRVHQIFIHGNTSIQNEDGNRLTLTSFLRKLRLGKHVKVVQHGHFKSVNNKFNPIQGITTDAVFLANENVSDIIRSTKTNFVCIDLDLT